MNNSAYARNCAPVRSQQAESRVVSSVEHARQIYLASSEKIGLGPLLKLSQTAPEPVEYLGKLSAK